MIPILFEKTETDFTSNGITRLHDCISCIVTEERNGIYEADFEFPINGAHYNEITLGRIIGVTHDESGDIQPFDIVSYSKPINGIVTFHCTHISYRQSYLTTYGTYIQNIVAAFDMLSNAQPSNPFTYVADYYPTAYMSAGDGLPHTVRELLGGIQGSILDTYGGEYEWDKWTVYWHRVRGKERDFSIRYGVNMLDYNDETSIQGAFSTCIPFWTDGAEKVVGLRTWSDGVTATDRGECVPLDLSDKFEAMPSVADLDSAAKVYMDTHNTYIPTQSIHVEFVRLQDLGYADFENLLECDLCDTINVIFPDYNSSGRFKIVKVVWDVLRDRYESMELGDLSVTLAEALGVSSEKEAKNNILNSIYPIGSVYISTSAVSPADLFGGTWVQIKGRFLLGTGTPDANTTAYWGTDITNLAGDSLNSPVREMGGESKHTLDVNQIPSHRHAAVFVAEGSGDFLTFQGANRVGDTNPWAYGSYAGGGGAHNNMPPYFAVYMWERTA